MSKRAPIEKDLTKTELKKFGSTMNPAEAVADVTELKELRDC